jgi:hypothetical protein
MVCCESATLALQYNRTLTKDFGQPLEAQVDLTKIFERSSSRTRITRVRLTKRLSCV